MTDPVPPSTPAPPSRPRRGLRWLLIGSLALNFLLVGLFAGGALRMWRAPAASAPAAELALLWRAMPDREALRREHDAEDDHGGRRGRRGADVAALRALILAEPFDRSALEARLRELRDRQTARADRALARMLDRIEAMSPAERARMADRLDRRWRRD